MADLHAHTHDEENHLDACAAAPEKARHVAIAQVLELGIAVHSVLIGIALGVSESPCSIRPLLAALTFHQFFEGIALGACLMAADFQVWTYALMAVVFALTTPVGIAIGLGITHLYNENSPTALGTQGVFDAVSAGILIYMALVDLIAVDFTSNKIKSSIKIQAAAYGALFAGAALMCALAIWA
jgi:zinc transporter 1/2/3